MIQPKSPARGRPWHAACITAGRQPLPLEDLVEPLLYFYCSHDQPAQRLTALTGGCPGWRALAFSWLGELAAATAAPGAEALWLVEAAEGEELAALAELAPQGRGAELVLLLSRPEPELTEMAVRLKPRVLLHGPVEPAHLARTLERLRPRLARRSVEPALARES
jgi:hypothetical protein